MFTAGPAGGAGQRVALGLGVPVGEPGLADLVVDGVHDGLHSVAASALPAAGDRGIRLAASPAVGAVAGSDPAIAPLTGRRPDCSGPSYAR